MNYDSEGNIKVAVSALTFATQVGMDIEAGSSSGFLSSLSFSNDNGVSFGLNGSTITASVNTVGGSSATISAGTQSDTLSQLVFADSNGVTFGLDNGTITASVGVGANINISAGTTSNNLSAFTFNNGNGISFGLDASTITASHNALTSQSNQAVSAGNGSFTFQTLTLADSNGVSFSTGTQGIFATVKTDYLTTAMASNRGSDFVQASAVFAGTNATGTIASDGISVSVAAQSVQPVAVSASNGSYNFSTLKFIESNGVTWATSTDGVRASVKTDYLTTAMASDAGSNFVQATAAIVGTNVSGTIASDKISISVNAQSSVDQKVSLYGLGNTTQNSSTVLSLNALSFNGLGGNTVGFSNGSIQISGVTTRVEYNLLSIEGNTLGTNTFNASDYDNIVLYGGNNITLSGSSRTVTLSVGNYITTARASTDAIGLNTAKTNVTWTVNSSGLSLDAGGYAGTGTSASNASVTLNSNGLAISVAAPVTTNGLISAVNVSAGTTSNNLSALTFANSNGISFGLNASTITATYTVPTVTNSSFSVQDSATTLNPVARIAFSTGNNITLSLSTGASSATVGVQHNLAGTSTGFGGNQISGSMTHNSSGLNLSLNHPAWITTAAQSNQVVNALIVGTATNAATNQSSSLTGSMSLSNLNGISFYTTVSGAISGVAASYTVPTVTNSSFSVQDSATTINPVSRIAFSTGNNITATLSTAANHATVGFSHNLAGTSTGFAGTNISGSMTHNSSGLSINLSVASQTNQTLGIYASSNTTMTSSGTIDARSLSFRGIGVASVGYSNNEVLISVPAGGGGITNINLSAGTTSNNASNFTFSNSNGISFGLNAGTITASHNGITSQSNQDVTLYATGNTTQNSSTVINANSLLFRGNGELSVGFSNGSIQISASVDALSAYAVSNTTQSSSGTLNVASLSFAGAGGASVGVSNGSVVVSAPSGVTLSTYEPYPAMGLSTVAVAVPNGTSAQATVYPFVVEENVSAGIMNMAFSMAFLTVGTSSGRQTMGLAMAIYSRNVSTLSSIVSSSFSMGVTGNNSSYTIEHPTSTAYNGFGVQGTTNSAGSNISSGYTGVKLVGWPINALLTPGNYWLGFIGTNSTSSVNVGISMSHFGAAMATMGSAMAPIGSFSSAFSTGMDPRGGRWNLMQGFWASAGSGTMIPVSMAHNSITAVGATYPLIKFWST